ncbi:MATE family efflux transporter [Feifania hominis]|uniref:MATE family efflux transporter n=1 Tax=Feifania hominis TaxID=2763660 RepID=A0A926DDL5_9FIRM|nr:MATE family efflux transporter [Feifania hominis]MBC8536251.1 MATE family efflux transporter [Feifania hominis]
MLSLSRDRSFYRNMIAIAVPIALQNLISFGVSMMDTVMVGQLGQTQLSASALANQPGFVFNVMTFGIGSGAAVLIAQYWGKKDMERIRHIFAIALRIAFCCSVILSALVLGFPGQIMRIFTPSEAVIAEGVRYLRVIGFTYLFFGVANTLMMTLRSIEVVRISVAVTSTSFVLNVILNYCLIFGKFGFPALGITGAAIATLCARISEFVIIVGYIAFFDKKLHLRFRDLFVRDRELSADFRRHGLPVVVNETLWSLAVAVQSMILGRLGDDAVAANSIVSVVQQFVNVFIFGISNASAVIVGKTIGEGRHDKLKEYVRTFQVFFLIIGACACGLMLLLKNPIINLYNVPDSTKALASQFMIVMSVIMFSISYTSPSLVGILRGGGDTRFVLMVDLIFMWAISVPFGAIAGLVLHFPAPLVFLCLKIDEPVKMIVSSVRIRSGKWIRDVTRTGNPADIA